MPSTSDPSSHHAKATHVLARSILTFVLSSLGYAYRHSAAVIAAQAAIRPNLYRTLHTARRNTRHTDTPSIFRIQLSDLIQYRQDRLRFF